MWINKINKNKVDYHLIIIITIAVRMSNYFVLSYSLRFSNSLACYSSTSSINSRWYATPNQRQHREKWINNDSPESPTFSKVCDTGGALSDCAKSAEMTARTWIPQTSKRSKQLTSYIAYFFTLSIKKIIQSVSKLP